MRLEQPLVLLPLLLAPALLLALARRKLVEKCRAAHHCGAALTSSCVVYIPHGLPVPVIQNKPRLPTAVHQVQRTVAFAELAAAASTELPVGLVARSTVRTFVQHG